MSNKFISFLIIVPWLIWSLSDPDCDASCVSTSNLLLHDSKEVKLGPMFGNLPTKQQERLQTFQPSIGPNEIDLLFQLLLHSHS